MNYQKIYDDICKRGQERILPKEVYTEKHHIIPKCLGGDNNKENLTRLTAREHFICHQILCLLYPSEHRLKFAFWAMCNQLSGDVQRQYKISSTTYSIAKNLFKLTNSKLHSNKKISESHKLLLSKRWQGEGNPNFGKFGELHHSFGKHRNEETKTAISKTKIDNPQRNASFRGYYLTPFGKFASVRHLNNYLQQTYQKTLTSDIIRFRCKNSDSLITNYCNQDLLTPDSINKPMFLGLKFKDLGWGFEPLSQK